MAGWLTSDSGVAAKNKNLESAQRKYTGINGAILANEQGQAGAQSVGQNQGQMAQNAAASAGASKGEAAVLGQNASNVAQQNAIAGETQKAAEANQKEVEDKEKQLEEAEAAQAEKNATIDKIGQANNAVGTAALTAGGTAIGGPVGGAIGAGLGAAVNLGRTAISNSSWTNSNNRAKRGIARFANMALSDERAKEIEERCGYHSKIKNEALLHLLDEVKDEIKEEIAE